MTRTNSTVKNMALTAVFAAFICIISPWTIPIGPVPISLGTAGVYLCAACLGSKRGSSAVAIYLLLGFAGLPVFTGFAGGIHRLFGPTGGYLVGYIPCAFVAGLLIDRIGKLWTYPLGMVLGTAVLYFFGTAWFCLLSGTAIIPALAACVLPFLPGDAVKIACASVLGSKLRAVADKSPANRL